MQHQFAIQTIYNENHHPIATHVLLVDRQFSDINTVLMFDSIQDRLDEIIIAVADVINGKSKEYSLVPTEDVPYMEIRVTPEWVYSLDQQDMKLETKDFLELLNIFRDARKKLLT